ncbi:MAG: sigma-70 family RNA polymerase sigma factor [Phycisphaerae bacterium]
MPRVDEKAFESLALPHLDAVYRFARRLSGDENEAHDLVQETYLKAYKAFEKFELREFGVKPWLLKILHNAFLNRQAKIKRSPFAADQQALDEMHADESRTYSDEISQLSLDDLDEEVKTALERLTPEFRAIILLWGTMEFSYQEIADILGIPIGTVMSRLHRARSQLLHALRDYAREQRLGPQEEQKE